MKRFTGDAAEATTNLMVRLPQGWKAAGDVGLFPCFTRGVNQYGEEDVESKAVGNAVDSPRVYGMFAHGELGPSTLSDFTSETNNHVACEQHSGSTILFIHTEIEI